MMRFDSERKADGLVLWGMVSQTRGTVPMRKGLPFRREKGVGLRLGPGPNGVTTNALADGLWHSRTTVHVTDDENWPRNSGPKWSENEPLPIANSSRSYRRSISSDVPSPSNWSTRDNLSSITASSLRESHDETCQGGKRDHKGDRGYIRFELRTNGRSLGFSVRAKDRPVTPWRNYHMLYFVYSAGVLGFFRKTRRIPPATS